MLEYVKVCPKCGHINPESAGDICGREGCDEFLGLVAAVSLASVQMPLDPPVPPNPSPPKTAEDPVQVPKSQVQEKSVPFTNRFVNPPPLYLEMPGTSTTYEIHPDFIVGQSHPTSTAHVQLSGIQGVNYVHRRHCIFECTDGQWFITAIRQEEHFTNPTYLNQLIIEPGQRYPLHNGDRLTLAVITLNVRLLLS